MNKVSYFWELILNVRLTQRLCHLRMFMSEHRCSSAEEKRRMKHIGNANLELKIVRAQEKRQGETNDLGTVQFPRVQLHFFAIDSMRFLWSLIKIPFSWISLNGFLYLVSLQLLPKTLSNSFFSFLFLLCFKRSLWLAACWDIWRLYDLHGDLE